MPNTILTHLGEDKKSSFSAQISPKAIDPELKYKNLLEDYKTKYAEKIKSMNEDFNWRLKEKEIGFETRLAEINEEYEFQLKEFKENILMYRKIAIITN